MKQSGRLHNLDYLRGLAASGIMIYHYSMWTNGHADIDSFICRVGVYGVSIFYVLSGLTLFVVYQEAGLSLLVISKIFSKNES